MPQTHFALTLGRLIKDHDWSHKTLAAMAHINQSTITRFVCGERLPTREVLRQIYGAFSDRKERLDLVQAYVRSALIEAGIPASDLAVPLEPSSKSIENVADRELYDLFIRFAESINAGDADLRDMLFMTAKVRLGDQPLQAGAETAPDFSRESAARRAAAARALRGENPTPGGRNLSVSPKSRRRAGAKGN